MHTRTASMNSDETRRYYQHLFPFNAVASLLKLNGDLVCREFAAQGKDQSGNDTWRRHLHATTKGTIAPLQIHAIEIKKSLMTFHGYPFDLRVVHVGGVFDTHPSRKKATAVGHEFVIDIDATDYEHLQLTKEDRAACDAAWPLVAFGLFLCEKMLREKFGFQELFACYSGGRGGHLWCVDEHAFGMTSETRSAVAASLNIAVNQEGGATNARLADAKAHGLVADCEEFFESTGLRSRGEGGLGFFDDNDGIADFVRRTGIRHPRLQDVALEACLASSNGVKRYEFLKKAVAQDWCPERFTTDLQRAVLALVWPRLDVGVSSALNHTIKTPFSAHSSSGRLCTPIFTNVFDFQPARDALTTHEVISSSFAQARLQDLVHTLIAGVIQQPRTKHPTANYKLKTKQDDTFAIDVVSAEPMEEEKEEAQLRETKFENVEYDVPSKAWFTKLNRKFYMRREGGMLMLSVSLCKAKSEFYGLFASEKRAVEARVADDDATLDQLTNLAKKLAHGDGPSGKWILLFEDHNILLTLTDTPLRPREVKAAFANILKQVLNSKKTIGTMELQRGETAMRSHLASMLLSHSDWVLVVS